VAALPNRCDGDHGEGGGAGRAPGEVRVAFKACCPAEFEQLRTHHAGVGSGATRPGRRTGPSDGGAMGLNHVCGGQRGNARTNQARIKGEGGLVVQVRRRVPLCGAGPVVGVMALSVPLCVNRARSVGRHPDARTKTVGATAPGGGGARRPRRERAQHTPPHPLPPTPARPAGMVQWWPGYQHRVGVAAGAGV